MTTVTMTWREFQRFILHGGVTGGREVRANAIYEDNICTDMVAVELTLEEAQRYAEKRKVTE